MNWETVIGLEVHAQLSTRSKLWCSCEISTRSLENTKTCEICAGHPGTLPVLNKKVLHHATLLALATHSRINTLSRFDRKNYFYPDLPKGYQITQFHHPFAMDGHLEIDGEEGRKKIGLERIQIEEDTGKTIHQKGLSLIDLNRAGTPLLEIVGRPHLTSAKEASTYLKSLHTLLNYLDICHGNLQEGNFRCDVNLSLRPEGSSALNTRTEIKNLNSFRYVEKAIECEISRQKDLLERGISIEQETLRFNIQDESLSSMRTKSDRHDYRYFTEPDLPSVHLSEQEISQIKKLLPELPDAKKMRFEQDYALPSDEARILIEDRCLADYFEEAVKNSRSKAKKVAHWILVELLYLLKESGLAIDKCPIPPEQTGALLDFVGKGVISGKTAKDVYVKMFDEKKTAGEIIEKSELTQINSKEKLFLIASGVIEEHSDKVEQYLAGKDRLFGFFVGRMMQKTKGRANPSLANEVLKELLKKK